MHPGSLWQSTHRPIPKPAFHYRLNESLVDAQGGPTAVPVMWDGATTTISYADGVYGKAAAFSGQALSIGPAHTHAINGETDGVTLCAWVNLLGTYPGGAALLTAVSSGILGTTYRGYGIYISATMFSFQARDLSATASASVAHNSASGWVHLAGVRAGGVSKLYVDGELADTNTAALTTSLPNAYWGIGGRGDEAGTSWSHRHACRIDDVYGFVGELTQDQIKYIKKGIYR